MLGTVSSVLDAVARTIPRAHIEEVEQRYVAALQYRPVDRLPVIMSYPPEAGALYPQIECIENPDKMLYNQLVSAFDTSILHTHQVGDDLSVTVRANFGTVVIASMLGAQVEYRGNDPGWVRPLGSLDLCKKVLEVDPRQRLTQGLADRVVATYGRYRELLEPYRDFRELTNMVLPDTQGPFDTAEQLLGSEIYIQMYEDPAFVGELLAYVAQVQALFLQKLKPLIKERVAGFSHQHAVMIKGNVLIRNDSTTLMSPTMYVQQVARHDRFVLAAQGGGGIHSCGSIQRLIPFYLQVPGLECIDIGQSELNDVDAIYAQVGQHNIPILRVAASKEELADGSIMKRFPTGVVLVHRADSFQQACDAMAGYKAAMERT
ncbi:MAG: hypothetical protein AB9828_05990 [Sphaerochaetaceae bacterium]